ncbi:MAG: DUF2835 domain-containing protein [Burkholderiales bacterium]|uniref:DUF2835 domain-containing protein n=1 Tax=Nitrosomonas sp. TaxID=42353 RepID=UPI001D6A05B0|nr:DUF2835 domain-containing protein [Nitrosomonas sp.]MCB1948102.1 DUF2835 domain-containing protein [Nitrosomonas sp.]MCP5243985.1 DUF2835 domain-containing protein [Burkholderiales bacterium]
MHQRLHVVLNISPQQLIYYYEGLVSTVVAKTTDGRTVHFPANILRSVVQANGVQGLFELVINENRKFVSIKRIDSK